MAARKRIFQDNLLSCSDESREDLTEEQASGTLDDFAAIVYDENLKAVQILQDDKKTHQTFKATLNNKERLKKRGPCVKGFLRKSKNRCQACYKRRNRILKSSRDLKIVAGDDTVVGFLKHPIDSGTEKLMLYSTLEDLVLKFKSLSLGAEAATTVVSDANISNTETVCNLELSLATPSKCNRVAVNKLKKKSLSTQSPNHCHICEVKHGSKLDNDYDSPWIGCSANKCETWLHLYSLGFMLEDGSDVKADWFCKKHQPRKPPAQRRMVRKK